MRSETDFTIDLDEPGPCPGFAGCHCEDCQDSDERCDAAVRAALWAPEPPTYIQREHRAFARIMRPTTFQRLIRWATS